MGLFKIKPFHFLFFLFSLPIVGTSTEIKFNYPPAKNNLEEFSTEELEKIFPRVEGIKSFKCSDKGCYVELNPILVDIRFKGFSIFSLPRLERYLGLKPYYRYSVERLNSVAGNVAFFLKNSGYLSPLVKTRIFIDKKGFATLTVYGDEGNFYLLGGFEFKTNRRCFSEREFLLKFKKPLGIPFSMLDLYRSLELAEELCRKKSPFYRIYTFYSEPFDVKRENLFHFLWKNFRITPFKSIDFLTYYADILVTNPYRGIKFLFKKTNTVYPKIILYVEGEDLKITIEGNKFFSKKTLEDAIKKLIYENGFISLDDILNLLKNKYRDSGFFDSRILIEKKGSNIKIKIEEGKRYRVVFIPKFDTDFKFPQKAFYSKELIQKTLKRLEKFLRQKGFYFKKIETSEVIDREKKQVKVYIFAEKLKPLKVVKKIDIFIPDRGLKKKVKDILKSLNFEEIVFNPSIGKNTALKIEKLLKKHGCIKPISEFRILKKNTYFEIIFKISCESKRKFGKTAYWIEGRLSKREIEYISLNLEGKRFNPKYLDLLRTRFEKTQLFENLSVIPVNVDNKTIPLVWGRERKPFGVEGWFGYTSDEGISGSVGLKIYDLLRWGEVINTSVSISQKRTLYSVNYFDNYLFSKKVFGGFGVFKKWEEHRDYKLSSKGISLTLGYHLNWWTDLSINLLKGNYSLDETFKGGNISKITFVGEINYPIYSGTVKRGIFNGYLHYGISLNKANHSKVEFGGVVSLLWKKFYTSFKGSFGYVTPKAPVFEKFYLGGIKNLKGYGYESVAPYGGGDIYWYSGIEIGFPIKEPIYLFGGFDFGNAVKRSQNPFKDFKKDVFIGGGAITAMGPIRIVFALPLEGKISLTNLKMLVLIGFTF